jgi:hypothetical protein
MACGCNRSVNYSVYSFVALTPIRESGERPDAEQGLLNKSLAETHAEKLKPVPLGSPEEKMRTNCMSNASKLKTEPKRRDS